MARLKELASFSNVGANKDGGDARGSLIADSHGNLFGTTWFGGTEGSGTVYEIPRTGTDASGSPIYGAKTILTSFTDPGGITPHGGLITDSQGNLYGTALQGGFDDNGTVFKLAHTGTNAAGAPTYASSSTTLVAFNGINGSNPLRDLSTDRQGNLYGTTAGGGTYNAGTVFEIARTGTDASGAPVYAHAPTTIVSFNGGTGGGSNGSAPHGSLFADPQGNLYGTTSEGGAKDGGTVFEIPRTGTDASGAPTYASSPTTLVSFAGTGSGTNGGEPNGSLIADAQGNLYGTTSQGGANGAGTVFEIARTGTSSAGAPIYASSPTVLVSFGGAGVNTNGGTPINGLIADAEGNLFGTTKEGGTYGEGTVFEIARTGTTASGAPTYAKSPTILVSFTGFDAGTNGANPFCTLIADSQGNLYGTTAGGGTYGHGSVFMITDSGFVTDTPATAPPTNILLSSSTVAEFSKRGTSVGTLSATDADAGDTFAFKLLDSAGGRFALSDTTLKVGDGLALDYEQAKSDTVTVQVTDSQGHSLVETLTVAIKDVNPEKVTGSARAETFIGGAKGDTLIGGGGNDTLDGKLGKDTLKGDAGKDTFFFSTKPTSLNLDHIKDFRAVDDTIKLENTGSGLFNKLAKGGLDDDAFAFVKSGKDIVDEDVRILYDKGHGALYYDPNGGSTAGRVEFAVLDNHAALSWKDFLIV